MTTCPFCKSDISNDATRCPHCTSFLGREQAQESSDKITYVVDRGLITFLKVAGTVFAMFLTVGLSFYLIDVRQMSKQIAETFAESQRLDINIKRAQMDLETKTDKIKMNADLAQKSAQDATNTLAKIQTIEHQAEESGHYIEQQESKVRAILVVDKTGEISKPSSNPTQFERLIETKLLDSLQDVLTVDQYARLQSRIKSKETAGLRRRVYDAKNKMSLPGKLVRSEGDAPIADSTANQVYDNIQIVHDFFKDVFGREIADDAGGTLIASIHFGEKFNNGFWNGQQIVLGDGDGKEFKKGAFSNLSAVAHEMSIAAINALVQLNYLGQAGALNTSFSDIFSVLVEQWQNKQTADKATWLVLADVLAVGIKDAALRSLKEPGTAHSSQPANMANYVETLEDNGGVHINSGIPSKAFYELAIRLKGFAWEKPAKIWYKAIGTLKPQSTFQDFADATFEATGKLYGEGSPERAVVVQSWAVVGIAAGRPTQAGK